jgi:carbonic anhydrase
MDILSHLFDKNKEWAKSIIELDHDFFEKLKSQQNPDYLWIGCSDSRVPANEIVGLLPGELFVHRNVSNLVIHTDMNCLSVLQYAIDSLKVKHVIVCGHYGCGGVKAALEEEPHGLIDNWLRNIRETYLQNETELSNIADYKARIDRLCELNVTQQVYNVCHTTVVQEAWRRGQEVTVHGWIYGVSNGLLQDLNVCVSSFEEMKSFGIK